MFRPPVEDSLTISYNFQNPAQPQTVEATSPKVVESVPPKVEPPKPQPKPEPTPAPAPAPKPKPKQEPARFDPYAQKSAGGTRKKVQIDVDIGIEEPEQKEAKKKPKYDVDAFFD